MKVETHLSASGFQANNYRFEAQTSYYRHRQNSWADCKHVDMRGLVNVEFDMVLISENW